MSAPSQVERARRFRAVHEGRRMLVLPNAWDVIGARVFEEAGFPAIGTTSFGIARAHGFRDGEDASRECSLAMVRRMAAALSVPLSADIEAGYGGRGRDVEETGRAFIAAGAVGFNIEDGDVSQPLRRHPEERSDEGSRALQRFGQSSPGSLAALGMTAKVTAPGTSARLVEIPLQVERIAALRAAGDRAGVPVFINARTDVFWLRVGDPASRLDAALERAEAYLAAGADGVFLPGLTDVPTIREAVRSIAAPVNLLASPGTPPVAALQELGVRRLSLGSGPMRAALGLLRSIAAELSGEGTYGFLDDAIPYDFANAL